MDVGVALWTLQSTAARPTSKPRMFAKLAADAEYVAELGFTSMWFAEHRFWYDGWCPSPLLAASGLTARFPELRFGTAVALPTQHEPRRFCSIVRSFDQVSGGRLELGIGLGHRDTEFDGLGLRRSERGRRMEQTLDVLLDASTTESDLLSRRVWIGGISDAALQRAASRGVNVLLPQTLYPHEVRATIGRLRSFASASGRGLGRIGMQQDVWLDADGCRASEYFVPRLTSHYREEAGAWWIMKNRGHGFAEPDALAGQVRRIVDTAAIGTPEDVSAKVRTLRAAGVDQLIVRVNFDNTEGDWEDTLGLFAAEVLPEARSVVR